MSRDKKYAWLNPRENSAKTRIKKAKCEVPHFTEHIPKFDHQITIKSYAESTVLSSVLDIFHQSKNTVKKESLATDCNTLF